MLPATLKTIVDVLEMLIFKDARLFFSGFIGHITVVTITI